MVDTCINIHIEFKENSLSDQKYDKHRFHLDDSVTRFRELMEVINLNKLS